MNQQGNNRTTVLERTSPQATRDGVLKLLSLAERHKNKNPIKVKLERTQIHLYITKPLPNIKPLHIMNAASNNELTLSEAMHLDRQQTVASQAT